MLKKSRSMVDSGIEAGDIDDQLAQIQLDTNERALIELKTEVVFLVEEFECVLKKQHKHEIYLNKSIRSCLYIVK